MPIQAAKREYSYQVWTYNVPENQAYQINYPDIETVQTLSEAFVKERIKLEIGSELLGSLHEEFFWIFHLKRRVGITQIEEGKKIFRKGFWVYCEIHNNYWVVFDQYKDTIRDILEGKSYISVDDDSLIKAWDKYFFPITRDLFDFDDIATWQ